LGLGYSADEIIYFEHLLKLGGLLHDIGHGPFSHALDSFLEEHNTSHEEYSKRIILETEVGEVINAGYRSGEFLVNAEQVAELIFPDKKKPLSGLTLLAKYLVSGPIDIDRMDYLNRDTQLTGVKYGMIDLPRTISILRAVRHNGNIQLAIKESGLPNLIDFFNARISMFKQIHSHKLKRIYDYHVSQVIRDYFGEKFDKSNLEKFLAVTDSEMIVHAKQNQNKNRHAQALIQRKHFKNILYRLEAYPSESKIKDIFERVIIKLESMGLKKHMLYDEYQKGSEIDIPLYLVNKNNSLTLINSNRYPELRNIGFHYFRLYVDAQHENYLEAKKIAKFYQSALSDLK
jgi:HD superfamily phosphohydrolase